MALGQAGRRWWEGTGCLHGGRRGGAGRAEPGRSSSLRVSTFLDPSRALDPRTLPPEEAQSPPLSGWGNRGTEWLQSGNLNAEPVSLATRPPAGHHDRHGALGARAQPPQRVAVFRPHLCKDTGQSAPVHASPEGEPGPRNGLAGRVESLDFTTHRVLLRLRGFQPRLKNAANLRL